MSLVVTPSVSVGFAPTAPSQSAAAAPAPSILPPPDFADENPLAKLYKLLADNNNQQQQQATVDAEARASERKRLMEEHHAAVEKARKAAEESCGFFDSIGLGGLAGLAIGCPLLVVADMGMHMARVTPEALRDFEKAHLDDVATAAGILSGLQSAQLLLQGGGVAGPDRLAALAALGGLLIKETNVLGDDAADVVGRALMLGGAAASGNVSSASVAFVADKEGVTADGIRKVEDETKDYTKYVMYAAMALTAAAAIVASAGTATLPVVLIGVALSASGCVLQEKPDLLGKDAEKAVRWIAVGLMASGALITGVGAGAALGAAAGSVGRDTGRALLLTGNALEAASTVKRGADTIQDAGRDREVSRAQIQAEGKQLAAKRVEAQIERILEVATDAKDGFRRMASRIRETMEMNSRTPELVLTAMRA